MEIKTIFVIGAGQMGHGIAQVAATKGFTVFLSDISQELADKGKAAIDKNLARQVKKEKITAADKDAILARITPVTGLAKAAEARAARADVKNQLKMGSLSLSEALASTDSTIGKLKVQSLLESLPGVGKVKARKLMDEIGIADNRRVQGLGQQQKAALLEQLGK